MAMSSRLITTVGGAIRHSASSAMRSPAVSSSFTSVTSSTTRSISSSTSIMEAQPREPVWSGKEHSESMEINPRVSNEVVDPSENPTAKLDSDSFHPLGSNSEQIIAGERSDIDPLAMSREQMLRKSGGTFRMGKGEKIDQQDDNEGEQRMKPKSPSLREMEDTEDVLNNNGP